MRCRGAGRKCGNQRPFGGYWTWKSSLPGGRCSPEPSTRHRCHASSSSSRPGRARLRTTSSSHGTSRDGRRCSDTWRGVLPLICQRCLERFDWSFDTRFETVVVDSGQVETGGLDALVCSSGRIELARVIEDELLLALPNAPVHPHGACEGAADSERRRAAPVTASRSVLGPSCIASTSWPRVIELIDANELPPRVQEPEDGGRPTGETRWRSSRTGSRDPGGECAGLTMRCAPRQTSTEPTTGETPSPATR